MYKLVAITGLPGSGKSVVSDYFVKKEFSYVRLGQVVLDEITRQGLEITEKNERKIREELRKQHGMDAFAKLIIPKIDKLLKKNNVVADGMYSFSEYKAFKNKFGDQVKVVAVYSPPEMRYERLGRRVSDNLDTDNRMRRLTIKEAVSRDYSEIENLDKGGTIAMADYTIVNTRGLKYLNKLLDGVYKEISKKKKN